MQRVPKHLQTALIVLMPVVWLSSIVLALNATSPMVAGPAGILIVFLLFYCFVASTTYLVLRGALVAWRVLTKRGVATRRQSAYIASVIALGPVFLVALNTLGQIGPVEVSLIVLLVGLGCFYVVRRVSE